MNITSTIKSAIGLNINWKHSEFHKIVDILSGGYCVQIESDEEKLASISVKSTIIGYLCLDYPIFFLENIYYPEIRFYLSEFKSVHYINVKSLSERSLSVDAEIYNRYFHFMEDSDNFSAEDFYFYNIN